MRIALGASRDEIVGLILREAMQLVASGLLLDLVASAVGVRLLESLLYGCNREIRFYWRAKNASNRKNHSK